MHVLFLESRKLSENTKTFPKTYYRLRNDVTKIFGHFRLFGLFRDKKKISIFGIKRIPRTAMCYFGDSENIRKYENIPENL